MADDKIPQEVLADLETIESVFDESQIPIDIRIGLTEHQLAEWRQVAYAAKLAYATNKAIGASESEVEGFIKQFSRARAAIQELETRSASLRHEKQVAESRRKANSNISQTA